jgi:hypothetical protein
MFINELAERRVVVIFCGRFQPFHLGHAKVYNNLVGTYGRNNVYIGTSGLVKLPDSPFTYSDRVYFMNLMGIPSDRILQLSNNYNTDVAAKALGIEKDLANTVMIFPVSQKDVDEKPGLFGGGTKKDGTPAKLQPLPQDHSQVESADKHAYIQTVNVEEFDVLGQKITGATSIRNLYTKANETQRQQIIKDLYGRYTHEAEQIMTNKLLPAKPIAPPVTKIQKKAKLQKVVVPKEEPVAEAGGTGVIANISQAQDPRYSMSLTRDVRPGQINKSLRAFDLAEDLEWVRTRLGESAVAALAARHIEYIGQDIAAIKQRIATEKLPAHYVEKLKEKIAELEQERAQLAFNPQ